jgi:hypothetical protein
MTYLDLVNNVLRRLREDEISTVGETDYSTMIGDIVNDAKRQIEDSWDWSALRDTITVATVSGTKKYALTGSANRATLIDATNDTSSWWLQQRSQQWNRSQDLVTNRPSGAPTHFATVEPNGSGDTQVSLYPEPDAIYSLSFNVVQRAADLSDGADNMAIPHMPVVQLAFAMAAREKGEVGGNTSAEIFGIAKRMLADAISQDSALNSTDMIWYQV